MKPLTYSQYRIEQALYIQQASNEKVWYKSRPTVYVAVLMYCDYLDLCGISTKNEQFQYAIRDLELTLSPKYNSYDENAGANINKTVQGLVDYHLYGKRSLKQRWCSIKRWFVQSLFSIPTYFGYQVMIELGEKRLKYKLLKRSNV